MSLDERLRAELWELAETVEPSTDAALRSVVARHDRKTGLRHLAPRIVAMAALLVVAGLVTWRLSGSGDHEPPIVKEPRPPDGAYGATLTGDVAGQWRLRFGKDTVSLVAPDRRVLETRLEQGTYDIRSGQITTDLLAGGPCTGPGSYTWKKADDTGLALSVVEDDCALRVRLLTGSAWLRPTDVSLAEGTYTTPPLTVEQLRETALAAGFSPAEVDQNLGNEGVRSVTFTLQLKNGHWTQFDTQDDAPPAIGWSGPYTATDGGTIVAGQPPCGPITYDYRVVGDQLHIVLLEDECREGSDLESAPVGELIAQTVIYETAPFTRVGE
jgi:hypothetical protein